ncbi:hypothetical protein GMORB2_6975 [Geosmithia morbida]|uniref:Uncharacterized protein n=1 Tax=Geosmithia morbida TaxID=1094350 RepID=A0A9P4YVX5_9HYPO|nr:uncharacterized protein GMORB2_6975 [Geosmithia morbida]KAF4122668.1 hypothetical protein GMORB2_6975 [Geosmithia morbida]
MPTHQFSTYASQRVSQPSNRPCQEKEFSRSNLRMDAISTCPGFERVENFPQWRWQSSFGARMTGRIGIRTSDRLRGKSTSWQCEDPDNPTEPKRPELARPVEETIFMGATTEKPSPATAAASPVSAFEEGSSGLKQRDSHLPVPTNGSSSKTTTVKKRGRRYDEPQSAALEGYESLDLYVEAVRGEVPHVGSVVEAPDEGEPA